MQRADAEGSVVISEKGQPIGQREVESERCAKRKVKKVTH